jgi:hypothetical protein
MRTSTLLHKTLAACSLWLIVKSKSGGPSATGLLAMMQFEQQIHSCWLRAVLPHTPAQIRPGMSAVLPIQDQKPLHTALHCSCHASLAGLSAAVTAHF